MVSFTIISLRACVNGYGGHFDQAVGTC